MRRELIMDNTMLIVPRIAGFDDMSLSQQRARLMEQAHTIGCINWPQYPFAPKVSFGIARSDSHLYINFVNEAAPLLALSTDDLAPVSRDSCVEIFLQPQVDGPYWNFEFNCLGALNASHRLRRPDPVRLTTQELASVCRHADFPRQSFDEHGVGDWQLTTAISLRLLGLDNAPAGTIIRGNVYACASGATTPYYLSYKPISTVAPDFHQPEFFGLIYLS